MFIIYCYSLSTIISVSISYIYYIYRYSNYLFSRHRICLGIISNIVRLYVAIFVKSIKLKKNLFSKRYFG